MDIELLSHQLTPNEIKNKEFKKTVLGYSPEQVVEFLDATARLWERVQKKEKELLDKIAALEAEIQDWKSKESDILKIREQAQCDANQIREMATEQGRKILSEVEQQAFVIQGKTEDWLASVLSEVEEIERRKANFVSAFRSALESHNEILKADQEGRDPLSSRLMDFLKAANKSSSVDGSSEGASTSSRGLLS